MQDHISILIITETVATGQDAILKAGLNKIMQSGKKTLVLDLTGATLADPILTKGIQTFEKYVKERGGRLLVASPLPEIGHVPSRKAAIDILHGDLASLRATEASLNLRVEKLEKQKKELEQRAQALKSSVVNSKGLRQENSNLKKRLLLLEGYVKRLLEKRTDATPMPSVVTKMETIHKTLVIVLEQEGLLPVR